MKREGRRLLNVEKLSKSVLVYVQVLEVTKMTEMEGKIKSNQKIIRILIRTLTNHQIFNKEKTQFLRPNNRYHSNPKL